MMKVHKNSSHIYYYCRLISSLRSLYSPIQIYAFCEPIISEEFYDDKYHYNSHKSMTKKKFCNLVRSVAEYLDFAGD